MEVEIRWTIAGEDEPIDLEKSIEGLKQLARESAANSIPPPKVVTLILSISPNIGYLEDGSGMVLSQARLQDPDQWAYKP